MAGVVVALIGVLGLLGVAGVGYVQWNKGRHTESALSAEKRRAIHELWNELEQIHVNLRHGTATKAELIALNERLIRDTPYLGDARAIAAVERYVDSLTHLSRLIEASADETLKEEWATTRRLRRSPGGMVRAADAMDEAREAVVRLVQGGLR